jgi:hypothetical protein
MVVWGGLEAEVLRCIINLVMNAAEAILGFTPPPSLTGSRLEVSTRRTAERVELVSRPGATTFTLWLPACEDAEPAAVATAKRGTA